MMVATDFSEDSRTAFQTASRLFASAAMALLHCYRPIADGAGATRAGETAGHQLTAAECARFLDALGLSDDLRRKLEVLLESGYIESVVKAYAADKGLDLLVVGSRGLGAVATLLLGSTAEKLLTSAPCDVLVVRASPAVSSHA
jgi:nucleotide-binding universal stress UspA family protein